MAYLKQLLYQQVVISGVVYVIDAISTQTDNEKTAAVVSELRYLLYEDELIDSKFVIFLNVQATRIDHTVTDNLRMYFTSRLGLDDPELSSRAIVIVGNAMHAYKSMGDVVDFFFG